MLQHIAITINNESEIYDFYVNILKCKIIKEQQIDAELSHKIFNIPLQSKIIYLQLFDLTIEAFVQEQISHSKTYNHICINAWNNDEIADKAKKSKYLTKTHKGKNGITYFLYDKSNNIFEIKSIT